MLGFGAIGKSIARLLKSFDLKIIYTNRSSHLYLKNYRYVSIEDLFSFSDILCMQLPLLPATYHLADERYLNRMKASAILINLSRWDIINMKHLERALLKKQLAGVFIDPLEIKHFRVLENFKDLPAYFFPHLGGNTYEAQNMIGEEIMRLIKKLV